MPMLKVGTSAPMKKTTRSITKGGMARMTQM
jgi:hypothetical protein